MTELRASDTVAAKIRDARKMRGWSMAELASHCGLSENIIENIESGRKDSDGQRRRDITVDELLAIADGLETGAAELLPYRFLGPHRTEREKAIRNSMAALEQAEGRLARLQTTRQDAEHDRHVANARLREVDMQMSDLQKVIDAERRTIALFQRPPDA